MWAASGEVWKMVYRVVYWNNKCLRILYYGNERMVKGSNKGLEN